MSALNAGPIKNMAINDPDGTIAFIRTADYPSLLQFVRDAYAEYRAENNDPTLEHVFYLALNETALANQISLASDFSLAQTSLDIKEIGARAVWLAMLNGATPTVAQKEAAVTKLKSELAALSTPSEGAFDFARYAANALIVLGDDAGLDIFLTSKEDVSTYSQKDNWAPNSTAALFQGLSEQYTQLANDQNADNNDIEKTMAAIYLMAKARRDQSQEIKPLNPIANLDQLKK